MLGHSSDPKGGADTGRKKVQENDLRAEAKSSLVCFETGKDEPKASAKNEKEIHNSHLTGEGGKRGATRRNQEWQKKRGPENPNGRIKERPKRLRRLRD